MRGIPERYLREKPMLAASSSVFLLPSSRKIEPASGPITVRSLLKVSSSRLSREGDEATIQQAVGGIDGVHAELVEHIHYVRIALHVVFDAQTVGKDAQQVSTELDSGIP